MTRFALTLVALAMGTPLLLAQSDCDGERYRYTSTYDNVSVSEGHVYGSNIDALGIDTELDFDFYEAVDNGETDRPLIIIAHGGFFLAGSNDGLDVVPMCEDFARMGYAVASISYRLGIANLLDLENELIKAVWRAVHDGRAAVRYFRKSVEEDDNPWGIDPERIFMGGVSAGGFLALHHAYVDADGEIPSNIDQTAPGMGGGLEGESGNSGYSSQVAGIFNVSGALKDASWMQAGDENLVSIHGTADGTVPYGTGSVNLIGFPVTEVDGSATLHEEAEDIGLTHCFITIDGAGHVPHVGNNDAYDITLSTIAGALSSWTARTTPTSAVNTTTPATSGNNSPMRCGCTRIRPTTGRSPLCILPLKETGKPKSGTARAGWSPPTPTLVHRPPSTSAACRAASTSSKSPNGAGASRSSSADQLGRVRYVTSIPPCPSSTLRTSSSHNAFSQDTHPSWAPY